MDFGLRDWLLIIGPLFIVAVLAHGYWRMRVGRNSLKMALDKDFLGTRDEPEDEDELAMLRAELPNGGARVRTIPEQTSLDLDEDVPVLMEPVEMGNAGAAEASAAEDTTSDEDADDVPTTDDEPIIAERDGPIVTEPLAGAEKPEKFIVFYVTALDGIFSGQALLETLVEQEMQFGEMSIFHRLDSAGNPLFSLANAVEPGTFDLAAMAELQTPAVSLFMRAHEVSDPARVLDLMYGVASSLADELGGEVKDQSRSVVTPQTLQHCRDDLKAYHHKYH